MILEKESPTINIIKENYEEIFQYEPTIKYLGDVPFGTKYTDIDAESIYIGDMFLIKPSFIVETELDQVNNKDNHVSIKTSINGLQKNSKNILDFAKKCIEDITDQNEIKFIDLPKDYINFMYIPQKKLNESFKASIITFKDVYSTNYYVKFLQNYYKVMYYYLLWVNEELLESLNSNEKEWLNNLKKMCAIYSTGYTYPNCVNNIEVGPKLEYIRINNK